MYASLHLCRRYISLHFQSFSSQYRFLGHFSSRHSHFSFSSLCISISLLTTHTSDYWGQLQCFSEIYHIICISSLLNSSLHFRARYWLLVSLLIRVETVISDYSFLRSWFLSADISFHNIEEIFICRLSLHFIFFSRIGLDECIFFIFIRSFLFFLYFISSASLNTPAVYQ